MAMIQKHLIEEYIRRKTREGLPRPILQRPPGVWASQFLRDPNAYLTNKTAWFLKENTVSCILYRVPAADIVEQWEKLKAKYEVDLQEALATQKDLREKDVDDSCVNGKVDNARRNIHLLTLQLKYMDREEDVVMQDHEMLSLFMSPQGYIDGPSGMGTEVAQERRY